MMGHRLRWHDQARRVFEREAFASLPILAVCAVIAWDLLSQGRYATGVAVMLVPVVMLAFLLWASPPRQLRRLERRAYDYTPASDGFVAMRGRVASVVEPVSVPEVNMKGAAAWWRIVDDSEGTRATNDEAVHVTDFTLRCGDDLIAVDAARARVLFDPRRAQVAHRDTYGQFEFQVAAIGDEVVVEGRLHHGAADGPHRASLSVAAHGRRAVLIGLVGRPAATQHE